MVEKAATCRKSLDSVPLCECLYGGSVYRSFCFILWVPAHVCHDGVPYLFPWPLLPPGASKDHLLVSFPRLSGRSLLMGRI